jgi:hypothetical protein
MTIFVSKAYHELLTGERLFAPARYPMGVCSGDMIWLADGQCYYHMTWPVTINNEEEFLEFMRGLKPNGTEPEPEPEPDVKP